MLPLLLLILVVRIETQSTSFWSRNPFPALDINSSMLKLYGSYIRFNTKYYGSQAEYRYRYSIFVKNLNGILGTQNGILGDKISIVDTGSGSVIKVKQPNGACDFEMSLNSFFDLTDEEFRNYYLMPAEFFDVQKYKPVSKITELVNGKIVVKMLDDDLDPFDELLKLEQGTGVTPRSKSNFLKNLLSWKDSEEQKQQIIQDLKKSFDVAKRKMNLNKLKLPENEGLTPTCRTQYRFKASFINGKSSFNYSYSQIPSDLDFSHPFNERRLQSTFGHPAKYLQQTFSRYTTVGGAKVPSFLDWNQISPLTPVKDQMRCNACYVFSATSALEAHSSIINDLFQTMSEQEIIDCSTENRGCVGGQPYLVYDYVIDNGLSFDDNYEYKGSKQECKVSKISAVPNKFNGIRGYVFPRTGVLNLIKALQYGPVVVVMYASDNLKYYYNGIFDGQGCNGTEVPNHSALVYGYNLNSPKPYFMLKNNWGTSWGDKGHFKMSIGPLTSTNNGHCFIAQTRYNVVPVLYQ